MVLPHAITMRVTMVMRLEALLPGVPFGISGAAFHAIWAILGPQELDVVARNRHNPTQNPLHGLHSHQNPIALAVNTRVV